MSQIEYAIDCCIFNFKYGQEMFKEQFLREFKILLNEKLLRNEIY